MSAASRLSWDFDRCNLRLATGKSDRDQEKPSCQANKTDFQFEVSREGEGHRRNSSMCCSKFYYSHVADTFNISCILLHGGRDCLVMPPSNFALLGLKDWLEAVAACFHQHVVCGFHRFRV